MPMMTTLHASCGSIKMGIFGLRFIIVQRSDDKRQRHRTETVGISSCLQSLQQQYLQAHLRTWHPSKASENAVDAFICFVPMSAVSCYYVRMLFQVYSLCKQCHCRAACFSVGTPNSRYSMIQCIETIQKMYCSS